MKKIFTLLCLMLAFVGSTRAQDVYTISYNGADAQSTAGFFTHSGNHNFNTKFKDASYAGIDFTSGLKMESSTNIGFTTSVASDLVIVQSTWSDKGIKVDGKSHPSSEAVAGDGACRIYTISNLEAGSHSIQRDGGESGLFYISVTYLSVDNNPSLNASNTSFNMFISPMNNNSTSRTFTLNGKNLTPGTLSFTKSNLPSGMTVSPATVTVASDGTVSGEYTIAFASTQNISKNQGTLSVASNGVTATITINYSSTNKTNSEETLSSTEPTIWNFANIGNGAEIELTATSEPVKEGTYLLGDLFDLYGIAYPGDFIANALYVINATYPIRRGNSFQDGTLKFNAPVDGTIEVSFADTGSSGEGEDRYLNVNGENTIYKTNRSNGGSDPQVTDPIDVSAGEILIRGGKPNGDYQSIVITKVVFTPANFIVEPMPPTVYDFTSELSEADQANLAADETFWVLDGSRWSLNAKLYDRNAEGPLVANGDELEFTEGLRFGRDNAAGLAGGNIRIDMGKRLGLAASSVFMVLPKTAKDDVVKIRISTTNSEGEVHGMAIENGDVESIETAESKDFTITVAKDGPFTFKTTAGVNVEALAINAELPERPGSDLPTAINEVENNNVDAAAFNLAGQRVSSNYKGIVVKNGKKAVVK